MNWTLLDYFNYSKEDFYSNSTCVPKSCLHSDFVDTKANDVTES